MNSTVEAYYQNKDKIKEILVDNLEYKRVGNPSVVEDYEPLNSDCDFLLRVSTGASDVEITLSSLKHSILDGLELENDKLTLAEVVDFLRFYGYPPAVRLSRILFIDDILKEI